MSTAPIESPGDIEGVTTASELERQGAGDRQEVDWTRHTLEGRLGELSGSGSGSALTWTLDLVRTTQREGEPVAWVTIAGSSFYPPDARRHGVDLRALPVVRTDDTHEAARAADRLLRSGGFGLVIVDLRQETAARLTAGRSSGGTRSTLSAPLQKRLVRHADEHGAGVLFLTEKKSHDPSLGAMMAFRAHTRRERQGRGQFACDLRAVADNRFGPGWTREEVYRGPPGLR